MAADVALPGGFSRMRLICLLNHCQHFPGFVYEKARLSPHSTPIEIDLRPRRGSKPMCSGCHRRGTAYDQLSLRGFEFIPVWGFAVLLLYRMRRVDCRACGVRVEELPWAIGKHQLTKAYMVFLAHWARKLSWKETALSFRTSWDKVCQAVEYVVEWGLEHRSLGPIRAIGVDEIQYAKGHTYLTLVYQIGLYTPAVDRQGAHRRELRAVLHPHRQTVVRRHRVRLLGHVEALLAGHPRTLHPRGQYPRPLSHRRQDERRSRRGACRRGAAAGPGRLRAGPQEDPVVRAQAQGQSHPHTTLPAPRPAALQPQDGADVPAQGRLPAILGLQLTDLGRQFPRRLVPAGHALANRADEEGCQDPAWPPRAHPQLFPGQEAVLQRGGRGPEQQGKIDHEKILRIPHLSRHRNCLVSRSGQITGAGNDPQILLTNQKTLRAAEREREDVVRARRRWQREQGLLDPAHLVFIDETAVTTNMVHLHGWSHAAS